MTTPNEQDEQDEQDEQRRAAIIYGYVKRYMPGWLRPGITLTPEQIARIRELQRRQGERETPPEGSA